MTLPHFKYNPYPLKLGAIKQEQTHCPVCKEKRKFVYKQVFYTRQDVKGICPWCIADGSAAKMFSGYFQDRWNCEDGVEQAEYIDELIHRTPSYSSWQESYWLSHCGDFCAIIEYVGWEEIKHLAAELEDDIVNICHAWDFTKEQLQKFLRNQGDFQGYLFCCVHCGKYRLHVDVS